MKKRACCSSLIVLMLALTSVALADTVELQYSMMFGSNGTANGQFYRPTQVAMDATGYAYVADGNNRVQKFDSSGNFVSQIGAYGYGDGQFGGLYGVTVASDGSIYTTDTSRRLVTKFDAQGNFVQSWGSYGTDNGQFVQPNGITAYMDSVYICDGLQGRVQVFTTNGDFVRTFGSGTVTNPKYVAIDAASAQAFVTDCTGSKIAVFTLGGTLVTTWGSNGSGQGQFVRPAGIAVQNGVVYVGDGFNARIQAFTTAGSFMGTWGSYGNAAGQFSQIEGVAVDKSGYLFCTDLTLCRVQSFQVQYTSPVHPTTWGGIKALYNKTD